MDKTVHVLLGIGIAILYPVLVLFTVMTLIADRSALEPQAPVHPTYPNCISSQSYYNQPVQSGSDTTPIYDTLDSCASRQAEYQQQIAQYDKENKDYQKQYDEWQKHDKNDLADRATLALIISIVTIGLIPFIRDIKELSAGLVGGAALTIVGAVSLLFEYLGTTNIVKMPIASIAASFIVLVGVMYWLEKHLTESRPSPLPAPPTPTPMPPHAVAHIHLDPAPPVTHPPTGTPPPPPE